MGRVLLLKSRVVAVAVDADQDKGFAFELLHERPLVWEHRHARWSPMRPKIEQYHLAAIVAELERLAVEVFTHDVRALLADDRAAFDGPFYVRPAAPGFTPRQQLVPQHR